MKFKRIIVFIAVLFSVCFVNSQVPDTASVDIYVRCSYCDDDYLRKELTIVNHTRDLSDANVVILGMSETNGSGGEKYRLIFEGAKQFKGMTDTLVFESKQDATTDEIRNLYLNEIKLGLLPYLLKTPLSQKITYKINQTDTDENKEIKDPWRGWETNLSISGFTYAESNHSSLYLNSAVRVYKVIEKWKFNFDYTNGFNQNIYKLDDYNYSFINRSNDFYINYVKSIGQHWSVGLFGSSGNSDYSNYKFYYYLKPAIEYDLFPYEKSFEKQLRIAYFIGYRYNNYVDTTIFNKTKELLYVQNLNVNFAVVKKWYDVSLSLNANQFLNNLSLIGIDAELDLSIRIFKGLNLSIYSGYSIIHNQVNLSKAEISQEDLLLDIRQMQTNYSYYVNIGFSYHFGSKFNNVVNPRFD